MSIADFRYKPFQRKYNATVYRQQMWFFFFFFQFGLTFTPSQVLSSKLSWISHRLMSLLRACTQLHRMYLLVLTVVLIMPSLNIECSLLFSNMGVTSPPLTEIIMFGAFSFQWFVSSSYNFPASARESSKRTYFRCKIYQMKLTSHYHYNYRCVHVKSIRFSIKVKKKFIKWTNDRMHFRRLKGKCDKFS